MIVKKHSVIKKTQKNSGRLAQLVSLKEGFVRSQDGTKIYYKSVGKGMPIILCNGMGVSTFFWKYFESHFKHDFRVITWDYRGHGRSKLPVRKKNVSVDFLVQDCMAVCRKLRIKKALFVGHSLGTQVALEFYHQHPKYVSGLISCFGSVGRPMDFFYNSPLSKYIFEIITSLSLRFPKQSQYVGRLLVSNPFWYQLGGLLKMMNIGLANKADAQEYVKHIMGLDSKFFTRLTRSVQSHSAEKVLKNVKVPTLIIGGEEDTFTPVWLSKKMHQVIPHSELFILRKGTHIGLIEQPDLINLRIEKFILENFKGKRKKQKSAP